MTIFDLIETFLDPLLSTNSGGFFLSVGFIAFISVALGLIKVPFHIILTSIIALFLMFASFGWIPLWIVILLALIIFALFLKNVIGGGSRA